jgi:hypothetical protein
MMIEREGALVGPFLYLQGDDIYEKCGDGNRGQHSDCKMI